MMKLVEWLVIDEEASFGRVDLNGSKVFIVEVANRYEPASVFISDSLKESVLKFCNLSVEDLENEDEKEHFDTIYNEIENRL